MLLLLWGLTTFVHIAVSWAPVSCMLIRCSCSIEAARPRSCWKRPTAGTARRSTLLVAWPNACKPAWRLPLRTWGRSFRTGLLFFPSSVFLLGASSLVTFLLPKKWRLANPQPDFLRMWMWWRSWSEVRQPWLPPTLASSRPWAWTWMPRGWMAVRSYKSSWLSATSELWRLWRGLGPRTGMDHNILRVDRWWRNSNRDHRIILYIWCDRFLMLVSKTSSICSYCGSFDVFWCLALLLNHLDSTRCDLICQSFLISKCDPHST